jgi:hypothetical protein
MAMRAFIQWEIERIEIDEERKSAGLFFQRIVMDKASISLDADNIEDALLKAYKAIRGGKVKNVQSAQIEYGRSF